MSDGRPRARDAGVQIGTMDPGPLNAITDVPDVRVGHVTLVNGDGPHRPGKGPVRTGVSVILPHSGNMFREKVPAAVFALNGFGKCIGQEQIDELGVIESPIALTGTMNVGILADGLIQHAINLNPDCGVSTSTVNPVVTECSDAFLNDQHGRHVRQHHVLEAIDGARQGRVPEGNVGAGTGMSLFGFKGGIGTASRVLSDDFGGYTVGALVLGNCGTSDQLRINGAPVGLELADNLDARAERDTGSIIIVIGTNAPMLDRALGRLARRAGMGLARTGSIAAHGSGDYILAFSNALRVPHEPESPTLEFKHVVETGPLIDALFQATIEATEEAIINALFAAETMTGRDGNARYELPIDRTVAILTRYGLMRLPIHR
ncbi:MAG: P1 family peptidase [Thermomicrobiaceae bacterium]